MVSLELDIKVIVVGLLIFLEALIGHVVLLTQEGIVPNNTQFINAGLLAGLVLISYFLAFLRGKNSDEEEETLDN